MNIEKIFKQYDIRGVVGQEITPENTFFIGQAFASFINKDRKVIIGHDGRNSSEELNKCLVNGLIAGGATVIDIGLCPTPMLYFASKFCQIENAVMITASHNPKEYNGFKFIANNRPLYGEELKSLITTPLRTEPGSYTTTNIRSNYLAKLLVAVNFSGELKIVWDISNGAGGVIAQELIEQLPNINYIINAEIEGDFPNHLSDSSDIKNYTQLISEVKKHQANYGFFLDGDADRLGVINNRGEMLDSDKIFFLFAHQYLLTNVDKRLIIDVKFSDFIVRELEKMGAEVIMLPSGHSIIKDNMLKNSIGLGGEFSGHFFFGDNGCYDDGFFAAIKLLEILTAIDKKHLLNCFPATWQIQKNLLLPSHINNKDIIAYLQTLIVEVRYTSIDGVRVSDSDSWWLLRSSNTENVLTLRIEARSQAKLEKLKKLIASYLIKIGIQDTI